jgi:general L-amino acid transport system substrate-binding protein
MQKALVSIAVAASLGLGATAAQAAILDDVKAKAISSAG